MLRGRTHLWILRAASLIVFVLVVSPVRAAKPPQRANRCLMPGTSTKPTRCP